MKESMWGYYLALLGISVSAIMIMVSNMTTTSQQNYYLLREVTNASMIDSIDFGYYRKYGTAKINTEKFVENFLRRFSESISKTNTYKIDFYSIYENPPSVSIRVTSNTGDFNIAGDSTNIDIVNSIDAVLEANNVITYSKTLYSLPYSGCEESSYISSSSNDEGYGYCRLTNRAELKVESILSELEIKDHIISKLNPGDVYDSSKLKILDVEYLAPMSTNADLQAYGNLYSNTYNRDESIDDVSGNAASGADASKTLAKNIKNVKLTLKIDEGKFYLGYGLDFNCEGIEMINENANEDYRIGISTKNMKYISESDYNSKYKDKYYLKPNESISGTSWFNPNSYITLEEYNNISDKDNYIKFERVPWYGSCLVGIKYKVIFYYDNAG